LAKKEKSEKKPRQQRLPHMDDPKIESLHNAALDYAEIRDERQKLTEREVKLKEKLIALMHEHGKKEYHYKGVSIKLVVESETVKVRIKKEEED
jgi:hypothetical protein